MQRCSMYSDGQLRLRHVCPNKTLVQYKICHFFWVTACEWLSTFPKLSQTSFHFLECMNVQNINVGISATWICEKGKKNFSNLHVLCCLSEFYLIICWLFVICCSFVVLCNLCSCIHGCQKGCYPNVSTISLPKN